MDGRQWRNNALRINAWRAAGVSNSSAPEIRFPDVSYGEDYAVACVVAGVPNRKIYENLYCADAGG